MDAIVAAGAFLFFKYICTPAVIRGASMEPAYHDGSVNACWHPKYWFRNPQVGDIVMIRYANRAMLFKRVVAVAGEAIEFRQGRLFVNGRERPEPWVTYPCHWEAEPVTVAEGCLYVIGDNRSMPSSEHQFGACEIGEIVGGPLW